MVSIPHFSNLITSFFLFQPLKVPHTEEDFKTYVGEAGNELVVLEFNASWCGPCQKIKPKVEELGRTLNDVHILECDVDELEDLDEVSDVSGVPTFMFLKSGKKITEFSGANEAKLIKTINELR